ncbi:MAG: T9SS type A sorting domain-containing protein [Chlorobi bacterium]|nr:T9SS type A sorting domain-containing protein [Chlorobiota bacterium]
MKTNYLLLIAIAFFFVFSQKHSYCQDFVKTLDLKNKIEYKDLQKSFYDWSKVADLNKTKGWKYYKRWENFNNKRTSLNGNLPDAKTYYEEYNKINDNKKLISSEKDNFIWTPVGLQVDAPTYNESQESGIGRINCITFHPTDSNIFWVGIAQGGVWKTTDHGHSWIPLTDNIPMLRISDIAVDKNNPDIIYISVGDYAYVGVGLLLDDRKRNTHYGIGVYKTTNGGQNWEPTGLSFNQTDFDASLIRRVLIDSNNSDILIAGGTNGIWKSENAGESWTQISEDLIWDIEQDPNNVNTLYASTGYINNLDMGRCGIIKSYDFGNTWIELSTGIPEQNQAQRIEITLANNDSNYVYAVACDLTGGLFGFYRSTNAGQSWEMVADSPNILHWYDGSSSGGQGTYDLTILVNPQNKDNVIVGGVNLWGSEDGGDSWNGVSYWRNDYGQSIHADQHYLAYNSLDQNYYICNDGGLYRTKEIKIGSWSDAYSQTGYEWPTQWERLNNGLMVTSFYRLGLSKNNDGYIIAGAQDNSTFFNNTENWHNIFGGDGMECMIHPENPNTIYGSYQYGGLMKSVNGGVDYDYITYYSIDEDGEWTTPYIMDPDNPEVIYAGYGNVWKTNNGGDNWEKISSFPDIPDLGQPNLCSSLAVSKNHTDYIYAAKRIYHSFNEAGSVWRTTNGGDSWTNITNNLPDSIYYTYIITDDNDPDLVWITLGGFNDGLKVFKTVNGGINWENISLNLPNLPVNCIVKQSNAEYNPVYIGMDIGIYYKNDTMESWMLYNNGFPNVIVSELEIHEATNKLYAATFGRGIWNVDLYENTDTTSGIKNPIYNTQVNLFPNPVNNKFNLVLKNVNLDNATISIIDITGKKLYENQISFKQNYYRQTFNLDLMPGLYFLIVSDNNNSKSKKFIVN